jgi:general stress protein 26
MSAKKKEITPEFVKQEVLDFLESQEICVLGTVNESGTPHVNGMHYVSDGMIIYLASLPNTQKLGNVARNSNVSITVFNLPGFEQRHQSRIIQLEGVGSIIDDEADEARIWELMEKKHEFLAELKLMKNKLIKVVPTKAMWTDPTKGPMAQQVVEYTS